MSVTRRNFFVPPEGMRCTAFTKSSLSWQRCGRRKLPGFDQCTQHLKAAEKNAATSTTTKEKR